MAKTVADPHVLQATNQPNMLQNLEEANGLLDEIMKGNRTIILIISSSNKIYKVLYFIYC